MKIYELCQQGELVIRIIIAALIGCMIGYERKNREKSAGLRTHAIVCMGAALMMVVSKYSFTDISDYDASRVAAQIVSGVGFLGAGTIFIKKNSISGLTTAAGIWATAGVGMAIGAGSYFVGICSGILVVVIQIILHKVTFLSMEPYRGVIKMNTTDSEHVLEELRENFTKENIRELDMKMTRGKEQGEAKIELMLLFPTELERRNLVYEWMKDERISAISG